MEFLPIRINDKKVYAGFWLRFCAALVDILVFIPVVAAIFYLSRINFFFSVIFVIIHTCLFAFYNIYFNAKFGGTIGKLAVNIRLTKPNGTNINWKEAWLRSSVDIVFAALFLIVELVALSKVDQQAYLASGFFARSELIMPLFPSWYKYYNIPNQIWIWGELIVLLFNSRKRAIHDFIAGTIVIHKEFAEPVAAMGLANTHSVLNE
jgi:uncharacterized RDD family membrane protein YckC